VVDYGGLLHDHNLGGGNLGHLISPGQLPGAIAPSVPNMQYMKKKKKKKKKKKDVRHHAQEASCGRSASSRRSSLPSGFVLPQAVD
jgi:hypothetical protein